MEGQKRIEDIIPWINKDLLKDSKKANNFKKIILKAKFLMKPLNEYNKSLKQK